MKLLYVCDFPSGGLFDYARRQVAALTAAGVELTVLAHPESARAFGDVTVITELKACHGSVKWGRLGSALRMWRTATQLARTVAVVVERGGFDRVLFASYREYFAPFWAGPLRQLAGRGVCFGTVAHDPVRDFVVGPPWWHRYSVAQGYSFIRDVFVHDETPLDTGGSAPAGLRRTVIPHGPYEVPPGRSSRLLMREQWGFGDEARVFLAFGHIRDAKNLDLFLQAMTGLPDRVKLVVAGKTVSGTQRPASWYQELARELGVAERCRWKIGYVDEGEVSDLFLGADFTLLGYAAVFRSASGVLNTAVTCRRPVLASSGGGPLGTLVERYRLGVLVEPDDWHQLAAGAAELVRQPSQPEWDRYLEENSWERNAGQVRAAMERD